MANLSHYNQKSLFGAQTTLSNLLESEDLCTTIRDEISPLVKDTDFEQMYKDGGRPPVSPRILVLTSIMQYIEGLSDRAAAKNVKFRLDWKIAFDLPVDFEGFHPTTLVYFRDRLTANEKATYAFDKVVEHLKSCGLIKARTKQRIDSTHIIGCVQELSRLDLLQETLRLFCEDVVGYKDLMNEELAGRVERYLSEILTRGISDGEREQLIREAGQTMQGFLAWVELKHVPDEIKEFISYRTLKHVFEQNFEGGDGPGKGPKLKKVATGKDHICSPHEPEARYGSKGGKGWLGYKGEVVETVTESKDEVNFITHIDVIESTDYDGDSVGRIIDDLEEKGIAPSNLYGDTHYNTATNIRDSAERSIIIEGPVQKQAGNRRKEKNQGFKVEVEKQKVICPMGIESQKYNRRKSEKVYAVFPKNQCNECIRRSICEPAPRGKSLEVRIPDRILEQRRQQMADPEYKKELHKRNGIEGTISGLVRGQNWRRSRYRGKCKTRLQAKFTGAAANILRLHRKRQLDQRNRVKLAA
jgi:transposase